MMNSLRLRLLLVVCALAAGTLLLNAGTPSGSEKKKSARGWLGVAIQDVDRKIAKKEKLPGFEGAYVTDVVDDSPADSAGLRDRDVIVEFAGKPVNDAEDLTNAVANTAPGTKATLAILRGGEKKTIAVVVGSMKHRSVSMRKMIPAMPRIPRMHFTVGHNGIGLKLSSLNEQLAEYFAAPNNEGVLVEEVEKGSAGDKAGFKAGDVILRAGKRTVDEVDDVVRELTKHEEGDKVEFEVLRKGAHKPLTVEVEEAEEDGGWNLFTVPGAHGYRFNGFSDGDGAALPELHQLQFDLENMTRDLKFRDHEIRKEVEQTIQDLPGTRI